MVGSRACGLFVIASLLCCGLAVATEQPSAAQMMDDLMYGRGRVGGPFTLTDQTGKQRSDTDFQGKLMDYLGNRKADLMGKILKEKALSDALTAELKSAVTEFKQTYK